MCPRIYTYVLPLTMFRSASMLMTFIFSQGAGRTLLPAGITGIAAWLRCAKPGFVDVMEYWAWLTPKKIHRDRPPVYFLLFKLKPAFATCKSVVPLSKRSLAAFAAGRKWMAVDVWCILNVSQGLQKGASKPHRVSLRDLPISSPRPSSFKMSGSFGKYAVEIWNPLESKSNEIHHKSTILQEVEAQQVCSTDSGE